jgi:(1->4)-alpha-D-glucan 1-alpha-D-glucosylmutase
MQVPLSTYRVQLNGEFTFADALAIVPYLAELGVGALYTSPILCATPGSMHGYDVTDYSGLNPEIGGEADLRALADALRQRGMGLIVDVVPNHMGIAGGANAWWQDVLENGQTSLYAAFFDIDWRPLKEELRGKILLPILGEPYGVVLERGELQLEYANGAFTVRYFATPLPIAPPTYPMILTPVVARLGETLAADDPRLQELQSIVTAFERLPPQNERDPERLAERRREQVVAKRRLADVTIASAEVRAALAETVRAINGEASDPRSFDALDRLLDAQSYRLSSFRTAGEEINYRRFFAINELAAVRQEVPEVFAAAHALLLRLIDEGVVTGLRIDHPDGLWDPASYFRELQEAERPSPPYPPLPSKTGEGGTATVRSGSLLPAPREEGLGMRGGPGGLGTRMLMGESDDGVELAERLPLYVVVEKILEPGEVLPIDWEVAGTVGYEFARVTTGLLVAMANRRAFDDLYTRFTGERRSFAAIAYSAKDLMLRTALASETNVLARALNRISEQNRRTRDFTLSSLRHALREVIASFPIYRTYIACEGSEGGTEGGQRGDAGGEGDRRAIPRAVALAKRHNPASDPTVFDFLENVLLLRDDGSLNETERAERCRFVMKFQQLTGPVMAKGVEDTAFYIYNRLIALNEVGGDPAAFGVSVANFHRQSAERLRRWPYGLLASSTHDTKRSEDARARIAVLSERPREWRSALNRWTRLTCRHKTRVEGEAAPDRNDEYLFYQTLLGAWPWGMTTPDVAFVDRIEAFMVKAVREAQVHTSWINPDPAYEEALRRFVRGALDVAGPNAFLDDLAALRTVVAQVGAVNALAQQLLKLTAPGVPDLYQGSELWDQSLVDPDNRRPVDYAHRAKLLRQLHRQRPSPALARALLARQDDGRVKLYLTWRTLTYRRDHPELFARGEYLPLTAAGPAAEHVVAFARRADDEEAIVVVPRLASALTRGNSPAPLGRETWGETRLPLPAAPGTRYRDIFSGGIIEAEPAGDEAVLALGEVFAHFPFALLKRVR